MMTAREYRTIHRTCRMAYEAAEHWVSFGPWTHGGLNRLVAWGWTSSVSQPRSDDGPDGAYASAEHGRCPVVSGMTNAEGWVFKTPVG